jgi:hypothetical protein
MVPSLGEGAGGRGGIWGTLPRSLVRRGGVRATRNQMSELGQKSGGRNKKKKMEK